MSRSMRSGRKLVYQMRLGSLPAPFEDFYSLASGCPNVTIITEGNRQPDDEISEALDGWKVIFVSSDLVTLEQARQELARVNSVDVTDILILEEDLSQAT